MEQARSMAGPGELWKVDLEQGKILYKVGHRSESVVVLDRALKEDPMGPLERYQLLELRLAEEVDSGSASPEEVEARARELMALRPDLASPAVTIAVYYRKKAKSAEAVQWARLATTIASHDVRSWKLLGEVAGEAGEYAEAQRGWETALELDPEDLEPAYKLMDLAFERGDLVQVAELLKRLRDRNVATARYESYVSRYKNELAAFTPKSNRPSQAPRNEKPPPSAR